MEESVFLEEVISCIRTRRQGGPGGDGLWVGEAGRPWPKSRRELAVRGDEEEARMGRGGARAGGDQPAGPALVGVCTFLCVECCEGIGELQVRVGVGAPAKLGSMRVRPGRAWLWPGGGRDQNRAGCGGRVPRILLLSSHVL